MIGAVEEDRGEVIATRGMPKRPPPPFTPTTACKKAKAEYVASDRVDLLEYLRRYNDGEKKKGGQQDKEKKPDAQLIKDLAAILTSNGGAMKALGARTNKIAAPGDPRNRPGQGSPRNLL